jgi:hypothetical protein
MRKFILGGIAAAAAAIGIGPGTAHAEDVVFIPCADGHSGIATSVTSCPFAENLRAAYLTQGGPDVIAYSPVTGMYYNMLCSGGYIAQLPGRAVTSVRCQGGDNAVVVLF